MKMAVVNQPSYLKVSAAEEDSLTPFLSEIQNSSAIVGNTIPDPGVPGIPEYGITKQ
jgi:hypothetical protein